MKGENPKYLPAFSLYPYKAKVKNIGNLAQIPNTPKDKQDEQLDNFAHSRKEQAFSPDNYLKT
ncbi:MAG: hypothetical protein D6805_03650 [Planctomycetota bacterium]|nr:MAG: hypothetical protein D6805_03650 [Planctomycetota bacterium]